MSREAVSDCAQVPRVSSVDEAQLEELAGLMRGRHVVALTGAGCSTESGIPDYRGEGTLARARRPVRFEVYAADPVARARYWSRAVVGWPRFCAAPPNAGHRALARLERAGIVRAVITQNVDRLHQAAGTREVVELHGALAEVRCLACGALEGRAELQERLLGLNPGWLDHEAEIAPDGDADLETSLAEFHVAGCRRCAGVLKPNVVFFGEQVPAAIVERAYALVESAELLVVLGSSLTVFSGLRFVRRAEALGTPIAIVNVGPTRGDALASLKIEARLGELLPRLAERLA
ncbi:NAD-dependent protein deacetylase [Enhygromyxa salina]|nr:NAD-dependent protein deacetylase [Enhygromyxa salina]